MAYVFLWCEPEVEGAGEVDFWTCASWAKDLRWSSVFEGAKYLTDVCQWFHSCFALLKFYVLFWVADFDEEIADAVTVVALQHDLPVLVGTAASAK